MSLANTYNCDVLLPDHNCIPCNQVREFARVRSAGFIYASYLATLLADPTDPTLWQGGIDAGSIIVVPETAGTYDPGDPSALPGYGERTKTNGPRDQKMVFKDPNYAINYQFYNNVTDATQLVPFYRTSSLVHIADVPASVFAKDAVADDLKQELVWEVTCDWTSANLPTKHDATGLSSIFVCQS